MQIQLPRDLGSLNLKNSTDQNVNEVCVFRDTEFLLIYFLFNSFALEIIILEAKQPSAISITSPLPIILIAIPA